MTHALEGTTKVPIPIFPPGATHAELRNFYRSFSQYVGGSGNIHWVFYQKESRHLPRFPTNPYTEATHADLYAYEEAQKDVFKEKYPEVDTPEKFQLASIKCCNTMRTMFQHHDDILQLIDNTDDDVRDAWTAIFKLTHASIKEYVQTTRDTLVANM